MLDHNLKSLFNEPFIVSIFYSIIFLDCRVGGSAVTDIRALRYIDGSIYFKLRHGDEWTIRPVRCPTRSMGVAAIVLRPLYESALKMSADKYKHLQDLKASISFEYHSFYDNLPH